MSIAARAVAMRDARTVPARVDASRARVGAAVTRKPPRRTATSSSYLSVRVVPRATAADASETTAKKSAPRWDLPRPPHDAGAAPENGTWSPTNQTIKDWRSLYKNTTLSVKGDGEGRVIEGAAIEGEIPKELKGTLFRNGPGLLEIYGKKLNQFFDGDGLVYSTTFDGEGGVKFRHNFVGTKGFTDEQAAQQMLYKGAYAI